MRLTCTALLLITVACGPELEPSDPAQTSEPGTSRQAVLGTVYSEYPGWDSEEAYGFRVSALLGCFGTVTNGLLYGFTTWRETSSNADDFTARLQGHCRQVNPVTYIGASGGATATPLIYSGNFRSAIGDTLLPFNLPIGVDLGLNPGGGYVRNLRLLVTGSTTNAAGYAAPYEGAGWAFTQGTMIGSNNFRLVCPVGRLLEGVELTYDSRNGKMRSFRLRCIETD